MRIRTVKPEFWTDETLSSIPAESRLLAIALLNLSDDEGYFLANPKLVKASCFPFLDESATSQESVKDQSRTIQGMIIDLSKIGYLRTGKTKDGRMLGHVVNFVKHQRIEKPKPSNLKQYAVFHDSSLIDPVSSHDSSLIDPVRNGMEWNGLERNGSGNGSGNGMEGIERERNACASLPDIIAYALSTGSTQEIAESFHDYNVSTGWQYKGSPIVDWQAMFRGYSRKNSAKRPKNGNTDKDDQPEGFIRTGDY